MAMTENDRMNKDFFIFSSFQELALYTARYVPLWKELKKINITYNFKYLNPD